MTQSRELHPSESADERPGSFLKFILAFAAVLAVLALTVVLLFEALKATSGHGLMQLETPKVNVPKAPAGAQKAGTSAAPTPAVQQSKPATGY